MKIRIKGNSIRIRLTQGETEKFSESGKIEDVIEFGLAENEILRFILLAEIEAKQISSRIRDGKISIIIPREIAGDWANSEQIGISGEQVLSPEKTLKILIEKDFTCLVPRTSGDDKDTFPHPKTAEN